MKLPKHLTNEKAAKQYAAALTAETGVARYVVRSDVESAAYAMGIKFGTCTAEELPFFAGYVVE